MITSGRGLKALLWLGLPVALAACASTPVVEGVDGVLRMKKEGASDRAILKYVEDPSRTFDLEQADVSRLVAAGMREEIINVMLWKSDDHHRSGRPSGRPKEEAGDHHHH